MRHALMLPAVAALLVPIRAQQNRLAVTYEIPPCFAGEAGKIIMEVDTATYPRFYYFLRVKAGSRYDYYTQTYHLGEGGRDTIEITIPSTLTSRGFFTVEFGFQSRSFQSSLPSDYVVNFEEFIVVGERKTNTVVDHDQIVEPSRKWRILDETSPYEPYELHDSYTFRNVNVGTSSTNRLIPFSAMKVTYANERFGEGNLVGVEAELRILDHIDDFPGLGEKIGEAYRSIPLRNVVHASNGYQTIVSFRLKEAVAYSQIDYRIDGNGPRFESDCLYAPLRMGHDDGEYRYQVFISNASSCRDSFIVSGSASFGRRLFGPCGSSEYCLVIGGNVS